MKTTITGGRQIFFRSEADELSLQISSFPFCLGRTVFVREWTLVKLAGFFQEIQ